MKGEVQVRLAVWEHELVDLLDDEGEEATQKDRFILPVYVSTRLIPQSFLGHKAPEPAVVGSSKGKSSVNEAGLCRVSPWAGWAIEGEETGFEKGASQEVADLENDDSDSGDGKGKRKAAGVHGGAAAGRHSSEGLGSWGLATMVDNSDERDDDSEFIATGRGVGWTPMKRVNSRGEGPSRAVDERGASLTRHFGMLEAFDAYCAATESPAPATSKVVGKHEATGSPIIVGSDEEADEGTGRKGDAEIETVDAQRGVGNRGGKGPSKAVGRKRGRAAVSDDSSDVEIVNVHDGGPTAKGQARQGKVGGIVRKRAKASASGSARKVEDAEVVDLTGDD